MPAPTIIRSNAKLNINLRVLPPDSSGYHPIQSTFQLIHCFDTITIQSSDSCCVTVTPPLPSRGPNIVDKVLSLLENRLHTPVAIHIQKHIPVGGGLGGGSSNAASVIKAIDPWLSAPLHPLEQLELATQVGMDVPFFLYGACASVSGYGERVTPIAPMYQGAVDLIIPPIGIGSADAYHRLDVMRQTTPNWIHDSQNDFKPIVWQLIPELAAIDEELAPYHRGLQLSGSGSVCYILQSPFTTPAKRDAFMSRLPRGFGYIQTHWITDAHHPHPDSPPLV